MPMLLILLLEQFVNAYLQYSGCHKATEDDDREMLGKEILGGQRTSGLAGGK